MFLEVGIYRPRYICPGYVVTAGRGIYAHVEDKLRAVIIKIPNNIMAPRKADPIIRMILSEKLRGTKALYSLPFPSSEVIVTLLIGLSDELDIVI